jgi:hypothetical protein
VLSNKEIIIIIIIPGCNVNIFVRRKSTAKKTITGQKKLKLFFVCLAVVGGKDDI